MFQAENPAAEAPLSFKTLDGKFVQGDRLLLALRTDDYSKTEFFSFSLSDGSRTLVNTLPAAEKVVPYQGDMLLKISNDAGKQEAAVSTLDLVTGKEALLYTVPNPLGYDVAGLMMPFLRAHPEVPVQIFSGNLLYSSDIAQAISTYGYGIDLFSTDTYSMAASRLRGKGYMGLSWMNTPHPLSNASFAVHWRVKS